MKLFPYCVVLLAVALTSRCNAEKLDFTFYITSRCGDTVRFVKNQLQPVYADFRDHLNIEFIPWGKSTRGPDGSVTCQFGPSDCLANRIQSCALYYLGDNQDAHMDYIYCEFDKMASVSQNYACVREMGLSETAVKVCAEGELGDELEAINEFRTSEIVMTFVPTIVYNHTYSAAVQNAAFSNFRRFVCSLLEDSPSCPTASYLDSYEYPMRYY